MDTLLRDVRRAIRALVREGGFTLAALTTLALGIGANASMFAVVHALVLRPLPYPDSYSIVRVGQSFAGSTSSSLFLASHTMELLREGAESFEQLAAYRPVSAEWTGRDGSATLGGAAVSPALFPLLRATPHLGRLFTEEEAREGADQVVLLSYATWVARFGSDPRIVGTVLDLDGGPRTVVGVLAEGFHFPGSDAQIWTPLVLPAFNQPTSSGPDGERTLTTVVFMASVLGRLRAGVSPEQAAAEVRTVVERDDPIYRRRRGRDPAAADAPAFDTRVIPLQEQMTAQYRPALAALTGATALVLLIACINVAGLVLARGVARQRELAVSVALGAPRRRLVRQLLTESVILGLGGGALGLAAAAGALGSVPVLVPGNVARLDDVGIDGAVFAFTLGLSVLVGLAFGAVPAIQWPRVQIVRVLNEGGARAADGFRLLRANRSRAALAASQVALALMLQVGAGLLLRSFMTLVAVDRGYDAANVITARTRNPDVRLTGGVMTQEARNAIEDVNRRFHAALLDGMTRVSALPSALAVGLSSDVPLAGGGASWTQVHVEGRPAPSDPRDAPRMEVRFVSPGYFDVMRLRLRAGRLLTRLDAAGSPRVLVVNEALVREAFGTEPALGQRLLLSGPDGTNEPWEVVGVVADVVHGGLTIGEVQPEAYLSVRQLDRAPVPLFNAPFVSVRTGGDPLAVVPFLREVVAGAHPRATLEDVRTMDARLSAVIAQPRFYAVLVGGFAALALFLAAFGVYALLSYTVAQRRREIGVRMALGARRGDILALVVRQGAVLVAAGAAAGILGAFVSSRLIESFLVGVTARDALTFVAAPFLLVGVALVACWLPARRATRVDPMEALRVE